MSISDNDQLAGALHLARLGYKVFPAQITPDGDKPPCRGVLWTRAATTEEREVRALWSRHPDGIPAIATGQSRIVVIDLDVKAGQQGPANWRTAGGGEDGPGYITPSGGSHRLYGLGEHAWAVGTSAGAVAPGVDVRGVGGYVLCYDPIAIGVGPDALPPLPRFVVERTRAARREIVSIANETSSTASPDEFGEPAKRPREFTEPEAWRYVETEALAPLRAAQPGWRNDQLNAASATVGHFVPAFWSVERVTEVLARIAGELGLGTGETRSTIRSGLEFGMEEPYSRKADPLAEPVIPEPDAVDALLAEMLDTDGLDAIGDLQPLVKGWLWRNTVARINGKSTHGKSFVALDIAGHVGTQAKEWRGNRVHGGDVLYLIAEGAEGFRKRVRAWEKYNARRMTGVRWLARPLQVTGPEWPVLVEAAKRVKPALVVLDTQARVTVGVDENDNTEMGVVIHQAEILKRETGACVVFVHHLGHNGEEGRGATAVKAALQTEILVRRDIKRITVSSPKQKDDADDGKLEFNMHSVELGVDEDGEPVTSIVLVKPGAHETTVDRDKRHEEWETEAIDAATRLVGLFMSVFNKGNGGTKAEVRAIAMDKRGMAKPTFYRAWNELIERGVIAKVEGTQSFKLVPVEQRMSVQLGFDPEDEG